MSWLLALLACGGPPTPEHDVQAYVAASRLAQSDPVAAAARCGEVGGRLVDECLAQTARLAPVAVGEGICEEVVDLAWRDECFFLVAEAALAEEAPADAAARCARAGRYQDNCLTHLWRLHASELLSQGSVGEAAERFQAAGRWPGTEAMDARSLDDRLWNKFFEGALSVPDGPTLDVRWCMEFPPELARSCNRQLPQALRRALTRVEREVTQGGGVLELEVLCGEQPLEERIRQVTDLRYVPSRRLDQVAQQFVEQRCRRRRRTQAP